jgi:hypothetical protein
MRLSYTVCFGIGAVYMFLFCARDYQKEMQTRPAHRPGTARHIQSTTLGVNTLHVESGGDQPFGAGTVEQSGSVS